MKKDNFTNNNSKFDETNIEEDSYLIKKIQIYENTFKDISLSVTLFKIIFFICLYSLNAINLSITGHNFSENAISAIGICHFYANCLFLSWTFGIFSGFDIIAPKAYASKRFRMLGIYFHMATIVGNILMIILLIINYYLCIPLISLFVKDQIIMQYVKRYIYLVLISYLFLGQFSLNFKYLNVIEKSSFGSFTIISSVILHIVICNFFIHYLKMNIEGLGYSLIIVNFLNFILGTIYITIIKPLPNSIFCICAESFYNISEYLKISIPNTLYITSQWIGFEIISFVALWVGKVDYTIYVIIYNLWQYSGVINISFIFSNYIIIGECIVLGDIKSLKKNSFKLYIIGVSFIISLTLVFSFGRYLILGIYTKSEELIEKGSPVMIVLGIMIIFDYTQSILCCISTAMNRIKVPLIISFTNNFAMQICLTILFGKYLNLGILGIWIGITISRFISGIVIILYLNSLDLIEIHKETVLKLNANQILF